MKGFKKFAAPLLAAAMMLNCAPLSTSAAKVCYLTYNGVRIAKVGSDGAYYMLDMGTPENNSRYLNILMKGTTARTVVLPEGTFRMNAGILMGSNKTLRAGDTKVILTDPQKQLIRNDCTATNYNSIKNVTIDGGLWYIVNNKDMLRDTSTIRFNHGQNITIKNATVYTNFRSHGIEIIACKDVTIKNCTVKCQGTPIEDRREEAVQIDVATTKTAPTCAAYGSQYVAGQTCRDITIDGCTITGSRALVCNRTDSENNRFAACIHHNITVKNCTLYGVTAEGLVLNNVQGFDVINNRMLSNNTNLSTNFSCGLSAMLFGVDPDKTVYRNHIRDNLIKGGKSAIIFSNYKCSSAKYGPTSIKNNRLYARAGANKTLNISNTCITKLETPDNRNFKW